VRDLLPNLETIIVPHEPETCELPEFLRGKATYAGEIVRPLPLDPVPLALRLGGGGKCVVITGGGGGYPGTVDFFNLALRAFSEVRKELPELQGVLIAGPLFHDWFKLELVEGMRVTPFEPEADSIFATADLVISQAGYNTIAELAALGTPAICIPAERGFDDQFERAATVAEQFPNVHLFTGANAGELPTMIHKCLEGGGERRRGAGPKGAVKAAECLYSLAIRARS